jgi:hypothetical protein
MSPRRPSAFDQESILRGRKPYRGVAGMPDSLPSYGDGNSTAGIRPTRPPSPIFAHRALCC